MPVKDNKVRKLVTIDKDLWAEIEDFRFGRRHKSESAAMLELLRFGLSLVNDYPKLGFPDRQERKKR